MEYKSPEVTAEKYLFDPKKNDIWCLGISLFMMIIGGTLWKQAAVSDPGFVRMMNGGVAAVLKATNRLHYVDQDLIDLFNAFFKYEHKRITMAKLKKCRWLNS